MNHQFFHCMIECLQIEESSFLLFLLDYFLCLFSCSWMFCVMLYCIQKLIIVHVFFAQFEDPDNAQEQVLWIQCDTYDMWYQQVCVWARILATIIMPCRGWHFLALPLLCCGERYVTLEKTYPFQPVNYYVLTLIEKVNLEAENWHSVGAWGWGIWLWLRWKCQTPVTAIYMTP